MKNTLLASSVCTIAFLISLPVNAADMVVEDVPVPVVAASPDRFCDAYAGVQAGYVWGDTDYSGALAMPTILDFYLQQGKNDGVSGGLYAGCNFRSGPFLWGVEGDINMMGTGAGDHDDWYGTLRLRAGPTIGNTLLFGTAGLAFGEVDMISNGNPVFNSGSLSVDTPTAIGWTVGGGVEHWFSDRISWKTEYLYLDLGKVSTLNYTFNNQEILRADWTAHTVRTGIAIHF